MARSVSSEVYNISTLNDQQVDRQATKEEEPDTLNRK